MVRKIFYLAIFFIFITFPIYADSEDIKINSRNAVLFDRNSKCVIYGKEENKVCKMASTTKIMTAIVVLENTNLSDIVDISKKAASTGGSRLGLSVGDKITVENLLYGLMMRSGNDAAVALAEHVGGSIDGFAFMMNKKALDLNLHSTHFVTPHGLDNDNHYTTAYDLALLADYALNNEIFAKIVKTKTYTIIQNGYPKTLNNTNELLGNFDGIYGVKTGFTNGANRCLVTSCKRGSLDYICVVLGCDTKKDRTNDSMKLLNYGFDNFSIVNVEDILNNNFESWRLKHIHSFFIDKGCTQNLNLYLDSNDFAFSNIAVEKTKKVTTNIIFNAYFDSPLLENTKIGEVLLEIGDKHYFSVDILNSNVVYKKNCFYYMLYFIQNYFCFFKKG